MSVVWAVFVKEWTDAWRDMRSMSSALVLPLLGPLLLSGMMVLIANQTGANKPLKVHVEGAEYAPGLVTHLRQSGGVIEAAPEDSEDAVRSGTVDVVLRVYERYGRDFRAGDSAKIEVLFDSSSIASSAAKARVTTYIRGYAATIGALRLVQRGIDPQLVHPVHAVHVDLSTAAERAGRLFNMIPMFTLIALFMGGMFLATDSTAGERERGSLEPLLSTGASRWHLVLGKWGATSALGIGALMVNLIGTFWVMSWVPVRSMGLTATFGLRECGLIFLVTAPLGLLIASGQMLVATFARSFREAQSYLSGVMLVPIVPQLYLTLKVGHHEGWMQWVPVLGQEVLMAEIIAGRSLELLTVVGSAVLASGLALALTRLNAWLLTQERIVSG